MDIKVELPNFPFYLQNQSFLFAEPPQILPGSPISLQLLTTCSVENAYDPIRHNSRSLISCPCCVLSAPTLGFPNASNRDTRQPHIFNLKSKNLMYIWKNFHRWYIEAGGYISSFLLQWTVLGIEHGQHESTSHNLLFSYLGLTTLFPHSHIPNNLPHLIYFGFRLCSWWDLC